MSAKEREDELADLLAAEKIAHQATRDELASTRSQLNENTAQIVKFWQRLAMVEKTLQDLKGINHDEVN